MCGRSRQRAMRALKQVILAAAATATLAASPARAGDDALVTYKSLAPEVALEAAQTALKKCRDDGFQVAVVVVDRFVTDQQRVNLINRCDAYVSLHRSEGFGLTLGEAMALGKPVIGTGFGGNTDFMTHANAWLVDYEETLVGPEGENYPAHGTWAEPDVDHAAELMRRVWEEREEASAPPAARPGSGRPHVELHSADPAPDLPHRRRAR